MHVPRPRDSFMPATRAIPGAAGWLALTFGAAWVGSRFLPGEWYEGLARPAWNPPNSIFAPVWTVLYLLMAVAAFLVWRRHGAAGTRFPLALFVLQLALNAAWSWLFFGLHRPDLAFVDIVVLWVAILATLISFWKLDRFAGVLLIPYLVWVSFAAVLNWTIWRMNAME